MLLRTLIDANFFSLSYTLCTQCINLEKSTDFVDLKQILAL